MSPMGAIVRKELKTYFVSPIAYVVAGVFLLLLGLLLFLPILAISNQSLQMLRVQGNLPDVNLNQLVLRPAFANMAVVMLLVVPILTMRLFAEEKKLNTLELLRTSPLTITDIVVGKFAAAFVVFAGMLALTALGTVGLGAIAELRWPPIATAYLGVLLLGGVFLSVGLLASGLTENQVIAVILSFGLLLVIWLFDWAGQLLGDSPIGRLLSYLSPLGHFDNLVKGLVDSKDLVYFLAAIVFSLFLTHRVLESQRWR
jgi:ABC-2 type transport system permease protein